MQVENKAEISASLRTEDLLTAAELVNLRKSADVVPRPIIGEKFYTRSESFADDEALQCALKSHEDTLNKKRAARICDLVQAEWNSELNASVVAKLKGKFVQHMGRLVNGKHVLSPEESIFLLENGSIEIMNKGAPMSTEEAYSIILKGNLSYEKYQVYSHLSQLGFIVVTHQTELGVTRYEKEMDLSKHQVKKKRETGEAAAGPPEKKRLTFSGALSRESELKTSSDTSQDNSTTTNGIETTSSDLVESNDKTEQFCLNAPDIDGRNCGQIPVDSHINKSASGGLEQTKDNSEVVSSETNHITVSVNQNEQIIDHVSSQEQTLMSDSNHAFENDNHHTELHSLDNTQTNSKNNPEESQPISQSRIVKFQESLDANSQSSAAQNSKDVDIMDVDSLNTDPSCCASETSRDNFNDLGSYHVNIDNDESGVAAVEDVNTESNFDVMSCSSSDSEDNEVLTLDNSTDHLSRDDDEVTLIEITKKETKPLAVIDLLSDDEGDAKILECDNSSNADDAPSESDDEIKVLDDVPGPSSVHSRYTRDANSRKLYSCKKEEPSSSVKNPKIDIPAFTVEFPDLFRKDIVCIARPPPNFLPCHVKPSKEAYILNLKQRSERPSSSPVKLWSSFRDMQEYQQNRRQNRRMGQPIPRFQNWNSRNSLPYDRPTRGQQWNRGRDRGDSSDSKPKFSPCTVQTHNFNGSLPQPMNHYQNQSNFAIPNTATMNSVVTIKQQDMNVSMVGNQAFHSNTTSNSIAPNFPPNISNIPPPPMNASGLGNNSSPFEFNALNPSYLLSRGLNYNTAAQLIAESHRAAYSMATNMLSSMLGRNLNPSMMPNPPFPTLNYNVNPSGSYNPNPSYVSYTPNRNNMFSNTQNGDGHFPSQNTQRNFTDLQPRFNRGRPFPCHYRNISNKQSWDDVRIAVMDSSSGSEVEEVPISPSEILWDKKNICPLVKPGVRYPVQAVLKFLQITQKAKVTNKYCYNAKFLPNESSLEISFDVYLPGFPYKKTCPDIPKQRIIVVKSTDPIPKYSEIAVLQRKWNDGASLQLAVVDNGDISFHSFNSISLPALTPHEN